MSTLHLLHLLQVSADDERPYALVDLDDDHASSTTPQLVRGYVKRSLGWLTFK